MNEIKKKDTEYTSTVVLAKQGVAAVGYLAGGILTLVMMTVGARFRIVGLILSVISGGVGVGALLSKDRDDKKPGMVLAAAGALELISLFGISFTRPLAGSLLGIGAIGLIALGIWKGVKFLAGLRSRQ
jgi:hypothetical protein